MIKNKAFTMSEALIVLGIVAVLAALSVVAINNSKPDENITMFRRAYSTTAKILQDMLNDRELYPNANQPDVESSLGAVNNSLGLSDSTLTSTILEKYPYLTYATEYNKNSYIFMNKANAISESVLYSDDEDDVIDNEDMYGDDMSICKFGRNYCKAFSTADGIYWVVANCLTDYCNGGIYYVPGRDHRPTPGHHVRDLIVGIYLNGSDISKSCSYDANSCPYPTHFTLSINKDGKITPQDPMACSYLRYPKAVRNSQISTSPSENSCFASDNESVTSTSAD